MKKVSYVVKWIMYNVRRFVINDRNLYFAIKFLYICDEWYVIEIFYDLGGQETGGGGENVKKLSKNWFHIENDGSDHKEYELLVRCYKRSWPRTIFTYMLTVLTVGVARLVFHWVPHWQLRSTCSPCHVNEAEYILIAVSIIRIYLLVNFR